MRKSKNVDAKGSIRILSHWGDSCVWRDKNGNPIKITNCQGETVTQAIDKKGRGNASKSEIAKQTGFLDASHDYSAYKYVDLNLLMPTFHGKASKKSS